MAQAQSCPLCHRHRPQLRRQLSQPSVAGVAAALVHLGVAAVAVAVAAVVVAVAVVMPPLPVAVAAAAAVPVPAGPAAVVAALVGGSALEGVARAVRLDPEFERLLIIGSIGAAAAGGCGCD